MTAGDILSIMNSGGSIGLLVLIIVGAQRRWYVWRVEFEDLREEKNFWRQVALEGLDAAERSLDLHERASERRAP